MTLGDEVSVRDILHFGKRRRGVLIRAVLLGLGLGLLASLAMPPTYRAATLVTQDQAPLAMALDLSGDSHNTGSANTISTATALATLAEIVKSAGLRDEAIAQLTPTMGANAARRILKTLRVKPVGQSQLLRITVDGRDPRTAAAAANTVANTLISMDVGERRLQATQVRVAIEQQLMVAIPQLRTSEDALALFQAAHKDVVLANQTTSNLAKLAQLEAELADVRLLRQEAQARIEASRTRLSLQARVQPVQWTPSPLIATLKNQLASEEVELSGMQRVFTPKYPALIAVQAKIRETKQRLDAELAGSLQVEQYGVDPGYQQLIQQLRQDEIGTAAYNARETALTAVIKDYDNKLRLLPAHQVQQARLIRASKQAETFYQGLADRFQQARVAEASIGSGIHVVDLAQAPERPLRPWWLLALLGAVVGLVTGAGGALMKERLVNPLASATDTERTLGIPVLGSIPPVPNDGACAASKGAAGQGPLPPWHRFRAFRSLLEPSGERRGTWSSFGGSFRYLRTNLMSMQKGSLRTLLVTSPGPDNESELVAANLAVALAHVGLRVWLVDCDLRRSPLNRGWANDTSSDTRPAGLGDLLERGTAPDQLLRPTPVERLSLLPGGTALANPSDLLAGRAMRAFVEQERAGVDVMVLSAPPVLCDPDAAALAPMMDGVLLVVHLATTPSDAATQARLQLVTAGARLLGAVVTGASVEDLPRYSVVRPPYDTSTAWYLGAHKERGGSGVAASRRSES